MMPLKLLLAEDVPDDAEMLVHHLVKAGYELSWIRIDTEAEFLVQLRNAPDIIFSDYSMPRFSGMRALELLQESGLDIPLILISGTVGEDVAVEAMRFGATDYFLKDRTVRLASAVDRALRECRLRKERRRFEHALRTSEMRLRSIIETTPECVKVVSGSGQVLEMNQAGLDMLEVSSITELQGVPLLQFIEPENREAFRLLHQRVMGGESGKLEFSVIGRRGARRILETHASPLRNSSGEVDALLGITRDITERRRNEVRIQEQLEELRRWRAATLGREDRVIALKNEINQLLQDSGQPPKYRSVLPAGRGES